MTCGGHQEHPVAEEVALSPTLRTILARQSLIMSAMFNLTEMVEDLLLASGKPRRPIFDNLATREAMPEPQARDRLEVATATLPGPDQDSAGLTLAARSADFGALRKRRRRTVLAILAALALRDLPGVVDTGPVLHQQRRTLGAQANSDG